MRICGTKGRLSPAFHCFSKPCSSADKTATKSCQIPSCFQNTCTKVAAADGLAEAEALSLLSDTHHTPGLPQTCPSPCPLPRHGLEPFPALPGSRPCAPSTELPLEETATMLEGTEAHQSKKRHLGVTGGSKGGSLSPKKRGGKHLLTAKKALTEKKIKKVHLSI